MTFTTPRQLALRALVATAAVALVGMPATALQGSSGTHVEYLVQSDGETMNIGMWLAPDKMRVDVGDQVSLITSGGDMTMVMHENRMYMVMTKEMMERMAGMMGGMMDQMEETETDPDYGTPPRFVATGNTRQVGEWSASEYRVEHPELEGETSVWFSEDIDMDFLEFAIQMADSLQSFNNPIMQRMGGGNAPNFGMIAAMRSQLDQVDMPAGFPVEMNIMEGGDNSVITLQAIEQGSLAANAFEPPAGYQKMEMPFGN